ncbi:MAG: molybdenum cofactor guanylyltransferase MobA, partial [Pseudomonadota bacterium]
MIPAVILAGGASRRMGGGVKPLLPLAGQPMIAHVIARLKGQTEKIAINANSGDFSKFGVPVFADSIDGFPGPLAGVLAAMDWSSTQGAAHVVTVAGDTPFFPSTLIDDLRTGIGGAPVALAATEEEGRLFAHSVFGLWSTSLADDLRAALTAGTRKVLDFTRPLEAALVPFSIESDPFLNINTPEDLKLAEARVA